MNVSIVPTGGGDNEGLQMGAVLTHSNGRLNAHGAIAVVQVPAKEHSCDQSRRVHVEEHHHTDCRCPWTFTMPGPRLVRQSGLEILGPAWSSAHASRKGSDTLDLAFIH